MAGTLVGTDGHDGDHVGGADGLAPGHVEGGAGGGLRRAADVDLGLDDFDGCGGQRFLAFVEHVAQLIKAGLGGGGQAAFGVVAGAPVVVAGALVGTDGHDGDHVGGADGLAPGHVERRAGGGLLRAANLGFGRCRLWLGFWLGCDRLLVHGALHLVQGVVQLLGVICGHEDATGVIGDTGQAGVGFVLQVEADDMRGELHALLGKLLREFAGVGVAGFQTVRDQYNGCLGVAIRQQVGGVLQ